MGAKDLPIWQPFPASEVQGVRGKVQLGAGSLHRGTGVLTPVTCFWLCPQLGGCWGVLLETGVTDLSRLTATYPFAPPGYRVAIQNRYVQEKR